MLVSVSPGLLLVVLMLWVISASVVRAPTLVCWPNGPRRRSRGDWLPATPVVMALASALSPFLGLLLKGRIRACPLPFPP